MKRDMELIRKILLKAESIESLGKLEPLEIEGYSADQLFYHAKMLADQGYLDKKMGVSFTTDGVSIGGGGLTFEGHEFLDAARSDTIWRKAMDKVASTTGSVSVDVLKALLIDLGKKALGL